MSNDQEHRHDHQKHGHGTNAHGSGHNHFHSHSANPRNEKRMALAAILTGTFMVVEVIGGLLSGSLALIADAGHMLTDCAALTLAWLGFKLSKRPADDKRTFGFDRFAILAAFVNGLSLFAISGWIIFEAVKRLNAPVEVMGLPMLLVAITGMIVNLLVFAILMGADKENLNIRGAALHVLGDLLGSAAAIGAALIIMFTGWMPADIIMSVLVSVIILKSAWYVVKHSGHILMEGAPENLDRAVIEDSLRTRFPEILDISHIHAWSISQERPMVMLEALITENADNYITAKAIKAHIQGTFNVEHVTVEVIKPEDLPT